jgi:MerR family transcriptional regulator/heat shock protein HspR
MTTQWAEPTRGLFSIAVAAELTGLHPQTLRLYEREQLLDPARSTGGIRRYSPDDIDRLHKITALTGEGLNLAGVRKVLELQRETCRLQRELADLRATPDRVAAGGTGSTPPANRPPRTAGRRRTGRS